jgi:hypothetical protein
MTGLGLDMLLSPVLLLLPKLLALHQPVKSGYFLTLLFQPAAASPAKAHDLQPQLLLAFLHAFQSPSPPPPR